MVLTKKDLEKLSEFFGTKEDLKQLATKEEINSRFDEVTKNLDWLMGAVQKIRDDLSIRFGQYKRHDDQLEDHEKRNKTIEEKVLVA